MVGTEDNNGGLPPSGMSESALKAALKAARIASGDAAAPGMEEPAAAAYIAPDAQALTKPVLNALVLDFKNRDAQHADIPASTTPAEAGKDPIARAIDAVEEQKMKSMKASAVIELEQLIARETDPETRRKLQDALEHVKDAKTAGEIRAAMATAPIESARSLSLNDSKADLGALHRDLYANDADYRRLTDNTFANTQRIHERHRTAMQKADDLAAELGISTSQDDTIRKLEEQMGRLGPEALMERTRIQLELYEARLRQAKEREQQTQNNPHAASVFGGVQVQATQDALTALKDQMNTHLDGLMDIRRKKLEKDGGMSAQEIEEQLKIERASHWSKFSGKSIEDATILIKDMESLKKSAADELEKSSPIQAKPALPETAAASVSSLLAQALPVSSVPSGDLSNLGVLPPQTSADPVRER